MLFSGAKAHARDTVKGPERQEGTLEGSIEEVHGRGAEDQMSEDREGPA